VPDGLPEGASAPRLFDPTRGGMVSPIEGGYFYAPTDQWGSYFWTLLGNLDRPREARVRRAYMAVNRYQDFLPLVVDRHAEASKVLAETGLEIQGWGNSPTQETMASTWARQNAAAVVFGERFSGPNTRSAGGFAKTARQHLDSWPGIDELLDRLAKLDHLRLHRHAVFVHDDGAGGVHFPATSFSIGPPAGSAIDHATLGDFEPSEMAPTAPLGECMADVQGFLDAAGAFLWTNAPPEAARPSP
jgi:hypothetical protein